MVDRDPELEAIGEGAPLRDEPDELGRRIELVGVRRMGGELREPIEKILQLGIVRAVLHVIDEAPELAEPRAAGVARRGQPLEPPERAPIVRTPRRRVVEAPPHDPETTRGSRRR